MNVRPLEEKSSVEEIRQRFDADVERFSKLETGQQAAVDSPLMLELVSAVAASRLSAGGATLDLGCGAGNLTLSVLSRVAPLHCTLVDLSRPMLERAFQRVGEATSGRVTTIQSDMRLLSFEPASFDVILAGAVLHHLRGDADWQVMFDRIYRWLKPGGTLLVSDLVQCDDPAVQTLMADRYGDYLESLNGREYREKVFGYVDAEDSPRSLPYQFACLDCAGFGERDVLHRNGLFAAFYATKPRG